MKKGGFSIFLFTLILASRTLLLAQDNVVKTIYLFPFNFYEESATNLNEVRLVWQAKPILFRYDDMSEDLQNILDRNNLRKMMNDPELRKEKPNGYNYRLYCIVTYEVGVNIFEDTTNIYIGFSPDNYMSMEYLNEKNPLETDVEFLTELSKLLPDKDIRKSIKKNIDYWKEN